MKKKQEVSKGQTLLTELANLVFPNEVIQNEHQLGEQLRLDIYIPSYKVGLEFHGEQHFRFIPHFHGTYEGFSHAQQRDLRKIELCEQQSISLVSFSHDEELSEPLVYDRVMAAIQQDIGVDALPIKEKDSIKGNPLYEKIKAHKNAQAREFRAKLKAERKNLK